jgi:hypothetical protein
LTTDFTDGTDGKEMTSRLMSEARMVTAVLIKTKRGGDGFHSVPDISRLARGEENGTLWKASLPCNKEAND